MLTRPTPRLRARSGARSGRPDPAGRTAPSTPLAPGTLLALLILLGLGLAGCGSTGPRPAQVVPGDRVERGLASWYGEPYHGRRAASGEVYDMHQLTAAHRSLPFGTMVRVTRTDTGQHVDVRINDRGPFVRGRIIDLSYAAARELGLVIDGVAEVEVRVLERASTGSGPPATTPGSPADPGPAPSEPDCLWVQVGAFSDAGNAARARDRLHAAGETALVMEGPGGLERVRVGPFDTPEETEAALRRLRPEWPAAHIVHCGS